jgi:long-chain fatty acid transport protein
MSLTRFIVFLLNAIILLMHHRGVINKIAICLILLTPLGHVNASGFAVLEQSVSGLGKAYSGGATGGEDIGTIFYNPAGLSEYAGTEIVSGTHLILPEARFKVDRSSDILNRPMTGGDEMNVANNVFIPNLYLATDLTKSFRLGLGVTVPFGSNTKYPDNWQGRYEIINSQLKVFDFNSAISYTLNNKISLGFGLSAQYAKTKLSNAIDFGTICIAKIGLACSSLGLSPQAADGQIEIEADGWSWGYNAGVLFKPVDALRFGIAYRSKVSHRLKGSTSICSTSYIWRSVQKFQYSF